MKIQVRINEEGALRNKRYAFSNRFALVLELLQNARRAGAMHITVDYDAQQKTLTVRDDGRGLDDFQKLLSFHESGWSDDLADREHPFGIGFTKCLYAATCVVVTSGRQRVVIDTAAALRRETFEVKTTEQAVTGTYVRLHGTDIEGLDKEIETLCQGFPVDVVFNGQPLHRRYAEDRIKMTQTPIGAVYIAGQHDGKDTTNTLVFLQGFCVQRPYVLDCNPVNVVHLDPKQFMARLPDRDVLIDADQQNQRIDQQLTQSWRQILEAAKSQLPARQFVETYCDTMRRWGHIDLLNTMDEVPSGLFKRITGYPVQNDQGERTYLERLGEAPSRKDIEQGRVTLISMDWVSPENVAHWMLARQLGWLEFDDHMLDLSHWIHPFVRHIEEKTAQVEPLEPQAPVLFEGRNVCPDVILCRAVRIRIGNDEAEITDAGVCHENNLLIPSGETTGEPVRQLSAYIDEWDRYCEDDMQTDRDALEDLILNLRSSDPKATLSSLLIHLQMEKYPLLRGRRFELVIDTSMVRGYSITELDSVVATHQPGGPDCHA